MENRELSSSLCSARAVLAATLILCFASESKAASLSISESLNGPMAAHQSEVVLTAERNVTDRQVQPVQLSQYQFRNGRQPPPSPFGPSCKFSPFGSSYLQGSVLEQLNCKLNNLPISPLTNEPFTGVVPLISVDTSGPRDQFGFTAREWESLSDADIIARVIQPNVINKIISASRQRDPRGLTLFFQVGRFASFRIGETPPVHIAAIMSRLNPACEGWPSASREQPLCREMFNSIRARLQSAGFGRKLDLNLQSFQWWDIQYDFLKSGLIANDFRARWLTANWSPSIGYAELIVEGWQKKYPDALNVALGGLNRCSGSRNIISELDRIGVGPKNIADTVISAGSPEAAKKAALEFAKMSREGGCGARQDPALAYNYMKRAGELGEVKAYRQLSNMYRDGEGTSENPEEAIKWLRLASRAEPASDDQGQIAKLQTSVTEIAARRAREGTILTADSPRLNIATVRSVMLREMQAVHRVMNPVMIMFRAADEQWNFEKGNLRITYGTPQSFGFDLYQSVMVSSVTCRPKTAAGQLTCTSQVSTFMNLRIGPTTLVDNKASPTSSVTDQFEFKNGEWRSPTAFARIMASVQVQSSNSSGRSNQSNLCRSLGAGVIAAGGSSTSRGLDPSTWGC